MSDAKKYLISMLVTVSLAFIGYFYTYQNGMKLSQRQEKLERVNAQLKNLYGPLYALANVEEKNWEAFRKETKPGGAFWSDENPPTTEEATAWRIYISEIEMPRYLKMEQVILENADLIEETEIPKVLLDLSIHIAGYKEVISRWKNNDFTKNTSYFNYPNEIRDYAKINYEKLKVRQMELLGEIK